LFTIDNVVCDYNFDSKKSEVGKYVQLLIGKHIIQILSWKQTLSHVEYPVKTVHQKSDLGRTVKALAVLRLEGHHL